MKPIGSLRPGWRALSLLLAVVVPAVEADPLRVIVVDPVTVDARPLEVWTQPAPVPARIEFDLDVGEEIGGRVLRVSPARRSGIDYRVQVQFETSAAVSGEGPHIDLLDWKHCRSEWRPARPVESSGFRLPMPEDRDHACFPKATGAELRVALRQALGKYEFDAASQQWWLDAVKPVVRVGDTPSYIAISTVRVRIEQYDGREWRLLTVIEFSVPMGC